jgi:uncharacterized protein (TIGR00730 family)
MSLTQSEPVIRSVAVFCGSSLGATPAYAALARATGRAIAERGLTTVYGGGNVGLMGVLADAALDAGGRVIGVIPRALAEREVAHDGLTALVVVESMHERKAAIAERSDAFLALPGGLGTLEEFCEILTWSQLGIHRKPMGLLNANGFYDPLIAMMDRMKDEGFVRAAHRENALAAPTPEALLDALASWRFRGEAKWQSDDERAAQRVPAP